MAMFIVKRNMKVVVLWDGIHEPKLIITCQFLSDQILILHLHENQAKNTIFDVQNGYRKGLKVQKTR